MPIYEYECKQCSIRHEELVAQSEINARNMNHTCPSCGGVSDRFYPVTINHTFKGGQQGNSGSHDVDYPTLDKAVGRSSEKKWTNIVNRQEKINKVRRESGQQAVSIKPDGTFAPTSKEDLSKRFGN